MPLYEYYCEYCDKHFELIQSIEDRHDGDCPECGKPGQLMVSRAFPNVFKPRWHPHIARDPIFIESKAQLKKVCKEHGKTSVYLEDS